MNNILLKTEFIQTLTTSVCPISNWAEMYQNHDAVLQEVINSPQPTIYIIRHLDQLIAELAAIRVCGVEKKCSVLCC